MKQQIQVMVANEGTKSILAYPTEVAGLFVHRQLAYVPGKEEHKFTSKWQITHEPSGLALLRPSECTRTMAGAMSIVSRLDHRDWSKKSILDLGPKEEIVDEIQAAVIDTVSNEEVKKVKVQRYVVRRNTEGPGFLVVDSEDESVVEEIPHRGLAAQKATELNEGVST